MEDFIERRNSTTCANHERVMDEIKALRDKTNHLDVKAASVAANLVLLIKVLTGTVVIASGILGSIYLSVANIDKQVLMIVTTVNIRHKQQEKDNMNFESEIKFLKETKLDKKQTNNNP